MSTMTKRVNINAPVAIRNVTPPICGVHTNIIMSTGDILKCICRRAIVDEILPNGSTVRLTMRNYYLDNGAGLNASTDNVVIEESETTTHVNNDTVAEQPAEVIISTEKTEEIIDEVVEETVDNTTEEVAEEPVTNVAETSEEVKVEESIVEEVVDTTDEAADKVVEEPVDNTSKSTTPSTKKKNSKKKK